MNMKKNFVLAMFLVLAMAFAVPVFASGNGDTNNYYDYDITNQGGQGGAGGTANASVGNVSATGGKASATIGDIRNTNLNTNVNTNKSESNSAVIGSGNSSAIIEKGAVVVEASTVPQAVMSTGPTSLSVGIENPKQYLPTPSVGVPELNFGQGKVDWYFANALPKIGIPIYQSNEIVKEVIDTEANIPIKKVLKRALAMKEAQMPIPFNLRIIVIKAEAQKSWTSGGSLSGGGSGVLSSTGVAGSGSLVPSVGGTKAHDLYTIILVKVTE